MAISPVSGTVNIGQSENDKNYNFALVVLTSLFFMWGFLTCLNDILIPHLKAVFTLNYTEAMLIQFVFFAAYFIMSLPSGWIIKKIGYKAGIIVGLITAGIGTLLFYPAAAVRYYPLFLLAFFILASGITLLQVAANPYVAILGKPKTASSRLNLTQAFNSLGTTIAPYFGALIILSVAVKSTEEMAAMVPEQLNAYIAAEAAAVQVPYLGLAAALFILAALFAMFKLPRINNETGSTEDTATDSYENEHSSAWGFKHLVLGAIGIFVYVGAEVSIGSFLVNFLGESNIAGLPESQAGQYVSFYWGGAMVGRFIGSAVLRRIDPGKVLSLNALAAAVLVLVTMLTDGQIAMWAILSVGLFNSIMFPTIFTLALKGLGKHTSQGSGILCMAIVGGAIVPVLQGVIADNIGIHHAFILPVICYFYIVHYGVKGSLPTFVKA
ncbi:MAG: L-fucose:H+ symporter permease [Ignavibacteriae bacterium HGW-Ignavibacteriae-2]|jgi:FHS family L-fucose permease-like MFS transporter|nr:L-fucose:H+ symporter permease [Bacteroidota bacterium]PKL88173.1 MAG: L-fucose:H+ symporter permease [Ignavibacteriae bacterium HGW-Ignavibacteriae-2]